MFRFTPLPRGFVREIERWFTSPLYSGVNTKGGTLRVYEYDDNDNDEYDNHHNHYNDYKLSNHDDNHDH